jgi:Domain of unknown function (DUF4786)
MDKLLLSLSCVALFTSLTVSSAPRPGSQLMPAIEQRQSRSDAHNAPADDEPTQRVHQTSKYDDGDASLAEDDDPARGFLRRRGDQLGEGVQRQRKMVGFLPLNALPLGYPAYGFYPSDFYDDFAAFYGGGYGEEDELMSRNSPGGRRRPSGGFKNSPIYYIRLPPTPYMFVPGLGYISQPPSYQPMAPVPQPLSPFYNLPLDFISNGKPTNIYQWGSPGGQYAPQPQFQPPQPQYQPQQFDAFPSYHQRPQRPYGGQRPAYSSMNPFTQESKVTNLKGPFLFNGRPEEIFVLPNPYNQLYPGSRIAGDFY